MIVQCVRFKESIRKICFVQVNFAGAIKPSAEIFQAVMEIAGCAPEECFFVDDLEINVAGTMKFGINAVQFFSEQQFEQELKTGNLI